LGQPISHSHQSTLKVCDTESLSEPFAVLILQQPNVVLGVVKKQYSNPASRALHERLHAPSASLACARTVTCALLKIPLLMCCSNLEGNAVSSPYCQPLGGFRQFRYTKFRPFRALLSRTPTYPASTVQ